MQGAIYMSDSSMMTTRSQQSYPVGNNPDWLTQDLFDTIESGDFPSWALYAQVLTPKQAETFK